MVHLLVKLKVDVGVHVEMEVDVWVKVNVRVWGAGKGEGDTGVTRGDLLMNSEEFELFGILSILLLSLIPDSFFSDDFTAKLNAFKHIITHWSSSMTNIYIT